MRKFVVLGVMFGACCLPLAHAGQETHGGNTVVCEGKAPVLLDYYHATLPTLGGGKPKLIDLSGLVSSQVVARVRDRLLSPAAVRAFDAALEANGPIETWIATDLQNVSDSAEPYILPPGCHRLTAAIRQGNTMYVDPSLYSQLSEVQRGLLIVHEALYRVSGEDTSASVRVLLRVILREGATLAETRDAVRLITPFFNYERVTGSFAPADEPDCSYTTGSSYLPGANFTPNSQCSHPLQGEPVCSGTQDLCVFSNGCSIDSSDQELLVLKCPDGFVRTLFLRW